MWLFELFGVLQEAPLLAVPFGVVLLLLGHGSKGTIVSFAGGAWLLYSAYEIAIQHRILCSGECNIRADLLLIYPALLLLSVAAIVSLALPARIWRANTDKNG